ncbi:eukaryotic translation initiation factor eIF2A-domain-containing protein [Phaeosphaeriaceae sp. PMI808]|nr:eukaryotic translation initiation factor eIF2A-domain-containing protein [Phaeosphaeriaceae sp. PMI808]
MAVPTQLAYRTSKGIGVFNAAPVYEPLPGFQRPEGNLRCCCYSPDSTYFAWASPEQVSVIDATTGQVITTLPTPNVFELGFSPLGTYIITWQRPTKDEDGNAVKNLKVWRTVSDAAEDQERSVVGEYVQKNQTGWNLQYTSDEKFCARTVTNEVQFYQSHDLRTVWNKLRVEGVTDYALSPGKNHSVAVFVPERKGMPAAVKVFQVPQFASAVSQKTFYKGDKVQLKWNDLGTSLIVLAQTEVDKTNKSYYGETNMYILSANGSFDSRITLDKEGPIHDVAWSPNSKEFGVVYGYMPNAKTTIFNARAVPQHSFDLSPRNTIIFSPHGRYVLVAGFGNLTGDVDIYDLEKNYAKVCNFKASNCTYCEWSPDGRHILSATTSPRLRVDNGIRIFHVTGELMYNEEMTEMYHVTWRPQPTATHPLESPLNPAPTPHPSALTFLSTQKTPSKPAGAYRPPGARGTTTPLLFKREDEGGAAYSNTTNAGFQNGFGKPRRREVPGAEPIDNLLPGAAPGGGVSLTGAVDGDGELSKAALKNKKKREAKKAREAADKAAGLAADGINPPTGPANAGRSPERRDNRGHQRSRSKNGNGGYGNHQGRSQSQHRNYGNSPHRHPGQDGNHRQMMGQHYQHHHRAGSGHGAPHAIQTENHAPAPDLTVTSPGEGNSQDKKMRGLLKKMRAIDELKMRQAGGEKLEDTQIKKIATEEQIRKELQAIGLTG